MHDGRVTRRGFLIGVGTALVGGTAIAGTASADHWSHQPGSVTITYDEAALDAYRPRLVLRGVNEIPDLYGWIATSPDYDTDAYVYWSHYNIQEGVAPFGLDSHFGDREPVYVFVDDTTGEIEEVVYSGWHWMAARTSSPNLDAGEQHPKLQVAPRHHQYFQTPESGNLYDVGDLRDEFDQWLANGIEEALEPGTAVNPWRMQSRDDWWRDSTFGTNTFRLLWSIDLWIKRLLGDDVAKNVDIGGVW